eukprot:3592363-Pyramimonas_sp.AAC.1
MAPKSAPTAKELALTKRIQHLKAINSKLRQELALQKEVIKWGMIRALKTHDTFKKKSLKATVDAWSSQTGARRRPAAAGARP